MSKLPGNPYADIAESTPSADPATLTLAYEQRIRSKIAYLTLKNRPWYHVDEELEAIFETSD